MAFLAACTGDDEPAPAVATESPSTPGATASPATLTPTPRATPSPSPTRTPTPSPSPTATPDPGPDLQSEGVQYLAYVDPDGVLWRVDELGGSRVRLAEGCGPEPPVWSPDGGWIACATGGGTLLLNSFAGSDAARADLQCDRAPKWPFGGALLACSPDRVADRNGERIAKFDEERYVQDFVWSPDGQYLIYEREDDPDRPFSLVLSDSAGNELGTITDTRGNVFGVDWSADGSRLTYVSYTEGSSANDGEIVLVDVPSLRRTVVDTSSLGRTAFGLGSVRRGGLPLTWALDDSVILVSGQARHEGGPMIVLDVDSGAFTDARPPNFWALAPDRRTVAILVPEHACILRIGIGEIGNSAVLAIPGSDWGEATCEGSRRRSGSRLTPNGFAGEKCPDLTDTRALASMGASFDTSSGMSNGARSTRTLAGARPPTSLPTTSVPSPLTCEAWLFGQTPSRVHELVRRCRACCGLETSRPASSRASMSLAVGSRMLGDLTE